MMVINFSNMRNSLKEVFSMLKCDLAGKRSRWISGVMNLIRRLLCKKESSPMVALTFDDGPGERTSELLNVLAKNHARATFFMLGENVERYPNEIRKMKEIRCEIANHSYDHPDLSKMDASEIRRQIDLTNQKFIEIVGQGAALVRPPYGAISDTLRISVGMPMILWSIDTLDWKTRDAETTVNTVMEKVKDGDIVLMHDIHTESIEAAIELIPKLIEAGYQLMTVTEIAIAKNIKLKAGKGVRVLKRRGWNLMENLNIKVSKTDYR